MIESDRSGSADLVNGNVVVLCDTVSSSDLFLCSHKNAVGTLGELYIDNIVDNTSFEIHSSSLLDQSQVNYLLIKK